MDKEFFDFRKRLEWFVNVHIIPPYESNSNMTKTLQWKDIGSGKFLQVTLLENTPYINNVYIEDAMIEQSAKQLARDIKRKYKGTIAYAVKKKKAICIEFPSEVLVHSVDFVCEFKKDLQSAIIGCYSTDDINEFSNGFSTFHTILLEEQIRSPKNKLLLVTN